MSINKQSAFNKYKNNSYFVGGKHYSATTNIRGDITQNEKKTGLPVELLEVLAILVKVIEVLLYQIKQ